MKRSLSLLASLSLCTAVFSCRTTSPTSTSETESAKTGAGKTSAKYNYRCKVMGNGGGFFAVEYIDFAVNSDTKVTITLPDGTASSGTLQPWKTPAQHVGSVQFQGFDGLSGESGLYTAVTNPGMLTGTPAHVDLRWAGEGFDHQTFGPCTKK